MSSSCPARHVKLPMAELGDVPMASPDRKLTLKLLGSAPK